jgi:thiol-disulfide isomerase/thioredoxin
MLAKKLRKNIDWIILLLGVGIIYAGGWQAEVFGFFQRGILATGIFNPKVAQQNIAEEASLNFTLQTADEVTINASEFEGKTIFINFWATWCPPCVAEMPGIHELYKKLEYREDIVFLMISVDDEHEKAIRFVQKKGFTFPIVFPTVGIPAVLRHQSIPATFVINREGKLVYKNEGMASYDSEKFTEFLKNL